MVHVKQEPSLLPGLHPPPSLGQEACTASRRQPQVGAGGHPVTQRLQVGAKVKVGREEEGQLLEAHRGVGGLKRGSAHWLETEETPVTFRALFKIALSRLRNCERGDQVSPKPESKAISLEDAMLTMLSTDDELTFRIFLAAVWLFFLYILVSLEEKWPVVSPLVHTPVLVRSPAPVVRLWESSALSAFSPLTTSDAALPECKTCNTEHYQHLKYRRLTHVKVPMCSE